MVASFILLPLFCSIFGITLDSVYTSSMKSNEQAQLKLQAYALIASTELNNETVWLPEQLPEDKLNQISSGLFAAIFNNDKKTLLWQSPSAINKTLLSSWKPAPLDSGKHNFGEINYQDSKYFFLQYSVTWEINAQTNTSFQFVIFNQQNIFEAQVLAFRKSLWGWLLAIGLSITLAQIVILKWGLKPIQKVSEDLQAIRLGQNYRLTGNYPAELQQMTDSINSLLETEAAQKKRYKESLSDLAHSLKTPLSVMQGSLYELTVENKIVTKSQNEISEQINRINQIINYQLKRSVNTPNNPFANFVSLRPLCEKLISTLNKVYYGRSIEAQIELEPSLTFKGDTDDLLEVLGNLLDNAYKYGNGHVLIKGKRDNNHLIIMIEDNGPGIPKDMHALVLKRGERADTSVSGQGIGLAIVIDIISHYGGSLKLERSSLGGLAVVIEL